MFSWKLKQGIKYLELEEFHEYGAKAYFTSRMIAPDINEFEEQFYSLRKDKSGKDGLPGLSYFLRVLDLEVEKVVTVKQVHGDRVLGVNCLEVFRDNNKPEADGLICRTGEAVLITYYADCVPLYFLDPEKKISALAHAGWRGTAARIGIKTLQKMKQEYGTSTSDCFVGIGPAICGRHYRVDKELVDNFSSIFSCWSQFVFRKGNDYFLDLPNCNRIMLEQAGIPPNQIIMSGMCTYGEQENFFSYRRDNGETGRMAAIIG